VNRREKTCRMKIKLISSVCFNVILFQYERELKVWEEEKKQYFILALRGSVTIRKERGLREAVFHLFPRCFRVNQPLRSGYPAIGLGCLNLADIDSPLFAL
jgi:hypothetical protein